MADTAEGLAGKRALVSGGTRGIGAAIAARLKAAGASVTAIGRSAPERLAADDFIAADVATPEGTDAAIEQVLGRGGIEIIVHVAGGGASAPSGGFAKLHRSCGSERSSSTSWPPSVWTAD
jgi:NAD(P)-dependent dehydrogenase (short-subunit alcohol dehydrogenase family)